MQITAFNGSPAGRNSASNRIITAFLQGAKPARRWLAISWRNIKFANVRVALPAGSKRRAAACRPTICRNFCKPIRRRTWCVWHRRFTPGM